MKKKILAGVVAGLAFAGAASSVSAARPDGAGSGARPAGAACVQAGVTTLAKAGLAGYSAANGVEVEGIGVLPLRTVIELHRTSPSLFQTGGVTVVLPGGALLPATWCD